MVLLIGWGKNQFGQINVPSDHDFLSIGGGWEHSLAVRVDGTLLGWGWNSNGQVNIPPGEKFNAVAGGLFHSVALHAPEPSFRTYAMGSILFATFVPAENIAVPAQLALQDTSQISCLFDSTAILPASSWRMRLMLVE
jgi:alpha-tubulin suppressor-like RCC1 family protein